MTRSRQAVLIAVVLLGCTSVVAGPEHSESYTGEVVIESNGSAVLIAVDTNKSGRDGLIDQWFTLESADAIVPVSEHLKNAQILHTAGFVRVTSPEQHVVYDFVVAGHDRALDVPNGFTQTRTAGYGLSHNFSPTKIGIARGRDDESMTLFDEIVPDNPDLGDSGGGGQTLCGSGGRGSTSCSSTSGTQSCTVTCGQGYYACCNSNAYNATCKCYRN